MHSERRNDQRKKKVLALEWNIELLDDREEKLFEHCRKKFTLALALHIFRTIFPREKKDYAGQNYFKLLNIALAYHTLHLLAHCHHMNTLFIISHYTI